MNKISIENAEKLSPQGLIELIINNVPYNNIRSCLTNLEATTSKQVTEVEEPIVQVKKQEDIKKSVDIKKQEDIKKPEKVKSENALESLRNMCKDDPILIIETNKKIKSKEEPQVIYYARSKKDNKYKKFSLDVSKFNKDTCKKLADEEDIICKATSEWIDEQLESGKDISEIRNVISDYLSSGINLYISQCPNFKDIKVKLGLDEPKPVKEPKSIKRIDVDEQMLSAKQLSTMYTPISDYLIYTKDRKENKIRVAYYDDDKKSWVTEDKDKSFIETIKESKKYPSNTKEYRLRLDSLGAIDNTSPKYKNITLIVNDIKNNSIELPYDFLNNL